MTELEEKRERRRQVTGWRRWARAVSGVGLLATGMAIGGHVVRDRTWVLALMMYLPLVPLGIGLVVLDLLCGGRALPWRRWILATVGIVVVIGAGWSMMGSGERRPRAGALGVTVLHWNVRWGGLPRGAESWGAMTREIARQRPGIVVLNEAPGAGQEVLLGALGPGWSAVTYANTDERYKYSLLVAAAWPVAVERRTALPNGAAMVVRVEHPAGVLRVMVVDGASPPTVLRTPLLEAVARLCREARQRGEGIDVIAGDFNAVGRSVGFDAVAAEGYELGSRFSREWRGTFPSVCPLWDIDHVWVGGTMETVSCALFFDQHADHRGQVVTVRAREPTTGHD